MSPRQARFAALIAAALAGAALFFESVTVGAIKRDYLDALVRSREPRALDGPDDPLVLVVIDQRSIELGGEHRRDVLAGAIERMSEAGPRVIALDLEFSRPDLMSAGAREILDLLSSRVREAPSWVHQEISALRNERDADARLVRALSRAPVVGTFSSGVGEQLPAAEALGHALDAMDCEGLRSARTATTDRPEYVAAIRERGEVQVLLDDDRVARRYPLISKVGDSVLPSFALAAASRWLGEEPMPDCAGNSVRALSLGTNDLPVNPDGATMLVDYRGSLEDAFPRRVSLADVYEGTVPPDRFRDKIVFVGFYSQFDDVLHTPMGRMNGIAIHGVVAHSILMKHGLRRPWSAKYTEALLALALAALASMLVLSARNPRVSLTLPVALAAPAVAHVAGVWLAEHDRLFDLLTPTLAGSVSLLAAGLVRWREERTRRETMERELSPFFSPEVLRVALDNPALLEPRRRDVSILFSDIRGFTRVTESIAPEALVAMLGLYLERMTDVVLKNGGQVDKYIGDAVMACFGAPTENPRHAHDVCRAALAMRAEVSRLQDEWERNGLPRLGVGIGVNTGTVLVGKMGSSRKLEYTSIGDDVNFASRAEGLTKAYGAAIIVGQTTAERVRDEFVLRDLGPVKVEGKERAVRIYELVETRAAMPAEPEWLATFHRGLAAFLAREWDAASASFRSAIAARGADGPSQTFLDEIARLRTAPLPADWDGSLQRHK